MVIGRCVQCETLVVRLAFFFFQAEDGIRDVAVTGVQTCALPIWPNGPRESGYECMPTVLSDARGPFGRNVPLAAAIRRALRGAGHPTPVVTSGGKIGRASCRERV